MERYLEYFGDYTELLKVTESKNARECLQKLSEHFSIAKDDLFWIHKAINYMIPNM